jgi:hypothetical protein
VCRVKRIRDTWINGPQAPHLVHNDFVRAEREQGGSAECVVGDENSKFFGIFANEIYYSPRRGSMAAIAVNEKVNSIFCLLLCRFESLVNERQYVIGHLNFEAGPSGRHPHPTRGGATRAARAHLAWLQFDLSALYAVHAASVETRRDDYQHFAWKALA